MAHKSRLLRAARRFVLRSGKVGTELVGAPVNRARLIRTVRARLGATLARVLAGLLASVTPSARADVSDWVAVDLQGDLRWTSNRFTDLEDDQGIDTYGELKLSILTPILVSPFASVVPSAATGDSFFFQRNVELRAGAQFYLSSVLSYEESGALEPLRGLRFFGQYARRFYWDEMPGALLEKEDLSAGADWFFDVLFPYGDHDRPVPERESGLGFSGYASTVFHETNFAPLDEDYDGLVASWNVKLGWFFRQPSWLCGAFPHVLVDGTWSPSHRERWFENSVRLGFGLRWYPLTVGPQGLFRNEAGSLGGWLGKRFNVYTELLFHAGYLGRSPDELDPPVRGVTDDRPAVRIGFNFSTDGFFGENLGRAGW